MIMSFDYLYHCMKVRIQLIINTCYKMKIGLISTIRIKSTRNYFKSTNLSCFVKPCGLITRS